MPTEAIGPDGMTGAPLPPAAMDQPVAPMPPLAGQMAGMGLPMGGYLR